MEVIPVVRPHQQCSEYPHLLTKYNHVIQWTTKEKNMNARMENALGLAEKCWEKANKVAPDFVERYLELAQQLLLSKPEVLGDEFREYCANNKLHRPAELHPNVWVSGVRVLKTIGWVAHDGYVTPTKTHNHMPSVTKWKSLIYGKHS